MSNINIINNFDTFLNKVNELHAIIEKKREIVKKEIHATGQRMPERITFEEIDMSSYLDDLLAIQKTLQYRVYHRRLIYTQSFVKRKALTVALAGVCQLIKDHYVQGAFWDIYENRIGRWQNNIYDLWQEGFENEGIELIYTNRGREFVDSFIHEAGIPRGLQKTIVDFFLLYWCYFRNENVEKLIDLVSKGETFDGDVPDSVLAKLSTIVSNIQEFKSAFSRRIERLISIVSFIEKSPDLKIGDVEANYQLIREKCGVDPREIIRNEHRLHEIWIQVFSLVTPRRFVAVLAELDEEEKITLPDGTSRTCGACRPFHYGLYRCLTGILRCVPDLSLGLGQLRDLPFDKIIRVGSHLFLKSKDDITAEIDGRIYRDLVKPLYLDGKFAGNIGFVRRDYHSKIRIYTSSKRVDRTYEGRNTLSFAPNLQCRWNWRSKIFRLYATHLNIAFKNAEIPEEEIEITVDSRTRSIGRVRLDKHGNAKVKLRDLIFINPCPGKYTFSAKTEVGKDRQLGTLELKPIMLFSSKPGKFIPEGDLDHPLMTSGQGPLLLFISKTLKVEPILHNFEIENDEAYGQYRMLTLQHRGTSQSALIKCISGEDKYIWKVGGFIDLELELRRLRTTALAGVKFTPYQAKTLKDFELSVIPNPEEAKKKYLQWTVEIDDQDAVDIPFIRCTSGRVEDGNLMLSGDELEHILSLAGFDLNPDQFPFALTLSLGVRSERLDSVRMMLFPGISTKIPDLTRGEPVSLQLRWMQGSKEEQVWLYDIEEPESSNARQNVFLNNGKIQFERPYFTRNYDVPYFEEKLRFELRPIVREIKVWDTTRQTISDLSVIDQRRLDAIRFLAISSPKDSGQITYSDGKIEQLEEISPGVRIFSISPPEQKFKPTLQASFQDGRDTYDFQISFDTQFQELGFRKHLTLGQVVGYNRVTGPFTDFVEFVILADGKCIGAKRFRCKPEMKSQKEFRIDIDSHSLEGQTYLIAKAFAIRNREYRLLDFNGKNEWLIENREIFLEQDIQWVKHRLGILKSQKRYFEALELLQKVAPHRLRLGKDYYMEEYSEIQGAIFKIKIESVSQQLREYIQKELQIDV